MSVAQMKEPTRGAKFMAEGIKKVFGDVAQVERCTVPKRRNVIGHLPEELGGSDRRAVIFAQSDACKGLDSARRLAKELEADHPDAASLREGFDDQSIKKRDGQLVGI